MFPSLRVQEKRLSDLSNQSHDSQVSNSTLSANSAEDRHRPSQREDLADGNSVQEEELDEMEVEYIEVTNTLKIFHFTVLVTERLVIK